ncbi:hypothetical protein DM480_17265 (plasmid) [Sphingomonas sp. FARSPH]|nr:hypothetical protein DM480_17265 [Sphingomonas sp. FARSPH]
MCEAEIVDQGDGVWRSIPRGFRVVWRPVAGARAVWEQRDAARPPPPSLSADPMPPRDGAAAPDAVPVEGVAPPAVPLSAPVPDAAHRPGILASLWEKARSVWPARAVPSTPASRSYRYLAQQLMIDFPAADRAPVILVSAACAPATEIGATMLLAAMLQDEAGGRLLIVDATLREGGIGDALGYPGAPGFLDLLGGRADDPLALACPTGREHVWMIPAGRAGPRGHQSPDAAQVSRIFDAYARVYEHVLVVQRAITTDTRYLPIAREAAVVLMMVEEAESRMADIDLYTEALAAHGIDDVRIVLCAQDTATPAPGPAIQHAA